MQLGDDLETHSSWTTQPMKSQPWSLLVERCRFRFSLTALYKACPLKIQKLLTDNGKEFTERLFASREREPSGEHEFIDSTGPWALSTD